MGKDSELVQAVKTEDLLAVQRIISKLKSKIRKSVSSKKSPLNFQDDVGFSALHHAALNGNCGILGTLLDNHHHIIVDLKDNKGMRPLHYAAWQGRVEPVRLLLQAGANPNEMSLDSETPLHLASQYGSFSVVETLLQYDADPTAKNKQGKTPLDLAAEFGKGSVSELLLNGRHCTTLIATTSHTGVTMHTPLHLAAKNGHSDVIRTLIDAGIDLNRETPNGTALHEAALAGKSEVVRLLIMSGIDVLKKNSHSQTALDIVNKFTPTRAAQDIKQILREAIGGCQAQAIKDYSRIHDRSAISFKAGDILTVLERHPDGRWKGSIMKGGVESIGYFPGDSVQLISRPPSGGQAFLPSYGSNTMPTGPYRNPSRSPSVDNITNHRYSTGSTASAGSSGTWSNRESIEHSTPVRNNLVGQQQQQQQQQQGGYEQEPPPPPHSSYPGEPSMAHSMDLPPPPPEMLHHGGHSPGIMPPSPTSRMNHHGVPSSPHYPQSPTAGNGGYYNQFQFPASAGSSPSRQPFRGKPSFDDPPWLRSHQGRNRPPSGADYPEDHTANGQAMRGHLGGMMGHQAMHNNKSMMHTHPAHSMDNMLASDFHCNDSQRPHSDGISDFHVDAISAQHEGIKDADRIYEWLRRQRLMEYTNNFTRSGYDMPTIAKMTPEDLTAIGITKPSHRKRITAMIAQMKEADPVPSYIPGDVGTWLRLLDLSQYHNTLMTNSYGVMEEVFHVTWEDLQDIGIDKLGHQKKIMLAVRRLRDLKKKGWVPGHQLNSDSGGSGSPQSSVDGITPLPAGFHLPLQERASPQSPQQEFVNPPLARKYSGVRSSRESLSSDISNRSAGSSSQDTTTPQDPHPPPIQLRHPKHHADASYVPSTASMNAGGDDGKRTPSPKDTPKADPKNAKEGNYSSFSTFKQPNANTAQTLPVQRAPQGIDRLIGIHKRDQSNRDSIGSASSFGSGSGSGSGDHSSMGSKKSLPPAPPRRTNSMITTIPDPEKLRTATIGRKKSMKPYHDRESAVAAGMARHPEITSGFATIKRTPSRKTDTLRRMQRSQSHDSEPLSAIISRSTEVIFKPPAAPSVPKVTPDMRVGAGPRVAPSDGQEDMNNSRVQPEDVRAMQRVMQIPNQMVNANAPPVERTSPKQMHHQQSHNQNPNQMANAIAQEVHRTSPKQMTHQQSHNQIPNQMANAIAQEVHRTSPKQMTHQQSHNQNPNQMANAIAQEVHRTSPKQMTHQQSHNQIPNQMANAIVQEVHRTSPKQMHHQQSHNQIPNQMANAVSQDVHRTSPRQMHHQQSHNQIPNQMANAIVQEVHRTSPKQMHHQQSHNQIPHQMANAIAQEVHRTSPKHAHLQQAHNQIPNQMDDMNAVQVQRTSPKQTHNQVVRKDSNSSAGSMPSGIHGVPTPSMNHQQDSAMHLQNAHNHHVQVQQQSRQDVEIPQPQRMNVQQDHSHYSAVHVPQSPRKTNEQPKNYVLSEQNLTSNYRPVVGTEAIEQAQNVLSEAIESKQGSTFPNGSYPHSKVHLRNEGIMDPSITNANVWDQGRSDSHTRSLSRNRAAQIERSLQSEKPPNSYSFVMPPPSTATVLDSGRRASAASSDNSSNSSESSGQQRRPGSAEVLWKKQPQADESAPVLQPVLSNPLQGIWRPKSRHQNRNSNAEIDEDLTTDMSSSSKGSEEDSPIKTQATFLQLKKQFLNTDSHPLNYQTLKRPPKKPEPLAPEFRSRSRSFTELDEFNQSPVSKYAPFSFETMNRNMNANSGEDDESSSPRVYEEIDDRVMSSFNKSSPLTSPRHSAVSQHQQPMPVPIPVVPVSIPQQPPYMQAPSVPVIGAVPPPPVGPPPAVPVLPKPAPLVTPEVQTYVQVQASPVRIPAPMSPSLPPPPPLSPMGPTAMSSAPSPTLPPPPPPIAVASPPPPPPPVPIVSQPPPPPAPPPPTNMQLTNLKQSKKAPALVPVNGKGSSSAPKNMMGNIGGGVDMMAELKLRQKKRQKVPVVSESWESNSDTIKRKPASPNEMVNEEPSEPPNDANQMLPPPPPEHTTSPSSVEVKKRAVPPVVLPKTRSPPKPSKPQETPTPPSTSTLSPRLIPIEDPMNRLVPIEEPKSRLVPIEDPKDVDIFSSDMDILEDHDEVVDSDGSESSDTLETGLTGFENENTDTIKKQPMRLSPRRQTAGETGSYGAEIITASVPPFSIDRSVSSAASNPPGIDYLPVEDAVSDEDSLGEATLKLEEILRSMAMEDPLADLMEDTWTPPPAPVLKLQTSPLQPSPPTPSPPPPPPPPEPVASEEPEEGKEVFNDIESMFANLALDLDSMMG